MQIKRLVTGPLSVNSYVISKAGSTDCAVIDPGDAEPILQYLFDTGLKCTEILLTHGHFDHIYGVHDLWKMTGARVIIHAADASMLESSKDSLAMILGYAISPVSADIQVKDGDTVEAAGIRFSVLHTPGHTKGGVCYVAEEESVAFCGDTIFCESVGRTDFSHSNPQDLLQSIRGKLYSLDESIVLYPGHGGETSIAHEKRCNPYVRP